MPHFKIVVYFLGAGFSIFINFVYCQEPTIPNISTDFFVEKTWEELTNCHFKRIDKLKGVRRWAYRGDELGKRLIIDTAPGDFFTNLGTVLDSSCFAGPREKNKRKIIDFLEKSLSIARTRMNKCFETFNLKELNKVVPVLSRSIIFCGTSGRNEFVRLREDNQLDMYFPAANMKMIQSRLIDYYVPLTPVRWSSEKLCSMRGDLCNKYGFILKLNKLIFEVKEKYKDRKLFEESEMAAIFSHEALHVLETNQRNWHNGPTGRSWDRCENSMFLDYTYFVTGLCFPRSFWGKNFFNESGQVLDCPGLCEKTLSEIDPEVVKRLKNVIGEPLLLKPYSPRDAKDKCNEMRRKKKKWLGYVKKEEKQEVNK